MGGLIAEDWRDLPDFTVRFEASSWGRIRRIDHEGATVLTQTEDSHGYFMVSILRKLHRVHRLVALAFLPPGVGLVLHGDGDRKNNLPVNLRYGTHRENNIDAVEHGTNANTRKSMCAKGHPYDEANTIHEFGKGGRPRRACRICRRAAQKRYEVKRKAMKHEL